MNKEYTFTQKGLFIAFLFTFGMTLNESSQADYFDGMYQNGQWENYQQRSMMVNNSRQGSSQWWGNGQAEGQAQADASAEAEFVIKLKAKARTNADMQQSRGFEGFMSQMRNMSHQMMQQRNFSNQIQHQYYQPAAYYPYIYPSVAQPNQAQTSPAQYD